MRLDWKDIVNRAWDSIIPLIRFFIVCNAFSNIKYLGRNFENRRLVKSTCRSFSISNILMFNRALGHRTVSSNTLPPFSTEICYCPWPTSDGKIMAIEYIFAFVSECSWVAGKPIGLIEWASSKKCSPVRLSPSFSSFPSSSYCPSTLCFLSKVKFWPTLAHTLQLSLPSRCQLHLH